MHEGVSVIWLLIRSIAGQSGQFDLVDMCISLFQAAKASTPMPLWVGVTEHSMTVEFLTSRSLKVDAPLWGLVVHQSS